MPNVLSTTRMQSTIKNLYHYYCTTSEVQHAVSEYRLDMIRPTYYENTKFKPSLVQALVEMGCDNELYYILKHGHNPDKMWDIVHGPGLIDNGPHLNKHNTPLFISLQSQYYTTASILLYFGASVEKAIINIRNAFCFSRNIMETYITFLHEQGLRNEKQRVCDRNKAIEQELIEVASCRGVVL